MIFSDKLRFSVVVLTHIDLATEEDKPSQINQWTVLFKATTWEKIKIISLENSYLLEASKAYYKLTQEEFGRSVKPEKIIAVDSAIYSVLSKSRAPFWQGKNLIAEKDAVWRKRCPYCNASCEKELTGKHCCFAFATVQNIMIKFPHIFHILFYPIHMTP